MNNPKLEPLVLRSLIKSRVRSKIIEYLARKHPNPAYLAEIEKATKSSRTHILGAIFGKSEKYSEIYALAPLGRVNVINDNGFKFYALTERGFKVAQIIES